jgi:uncharacterized protein YjiS (DUF1127 family)
MHTFPLRNDLAAVTTRALARLARVCAELWTTWSEAQYARASRRVLRNLDDRILLDIGLTRSEIGSLDAERRGAAEPTRVWTLRSYQGRA